MKRIRRNVVGLLILLVAAGCPLFAQDKEVVVVRYSMLWQTISPGEPLVVNMEIENLLGESITIDLGQGQTDGVRATVTPPNGPTFPIQRTTANQNKCCGMYFGPMPIATLEAKQVLKQQMVFVDWYKGPIYGKYGVDLKFINPSARAESGSVSQIGPGNILEFTVVPQDGATLRARWDALEEAVRISDHPLTRSDAALVLSQVSDPGVIPYLKRLAYIDESFVRLATGALERQATPSATGALEELSHSRDAIVGGAASAALTRLRKR
jgi:hypothetical protein